MRRERAQEIAQSLNRITGYVVEDGKEPTWDELQEFSALALRATDPDMVGLQNDTGSWAEQQFPESTPESVMKHADEEFGELKDAVESRDEGVKELAIADVGEEAADVVLLLMHLCHKLDINLYEGCLTKLAINKGRKWETKPNRQGYYKHEDQS